MTSALILDRGGIDVTLFERFDSPQPLGSGIVLKPTGLAVLEELGLLSAIYSLGKRIDRMVGTTMPAAKRVLDVHYESLGEDMHGLAVHRAALFDVLFAAVKRAEISIQTGVDAASIRRTSSDVFLEDRSQREWGPFDLIVDASGSNSSLHGFAALPLRKKSLQYGAIWGAFGWPDADFRSNYLDQRYVGAHTMIGVLPIGRHAGVDRDQVAFFWSLRSQDYGAWLAAGMDDWKNKVLSIWPQTCSILDQIETPEQMTMARYGHHTLRRPYGHRIAFIGDAAHSTSPQLGQGANMALLDAWALGQALVARRDLSAALRRYAELRRWHVRIFQFASLALTPFYQSDSKSLSWLRDLLFDPMSRLPVARRVVAGLISGLLTRPLQKLGLKVPKSPD